MTQNLPSGRLLRGQPWPVFKTCGRGAVSAAKDLRRGEHGASLIEMAIVLPPFFMLLIGCFSFSIVLFGRGNAICAANVAARYAALHSSTALTQASTSSITSVATPYLYAVASPASDVNVSYIPANSNTIGSTVKVTVTVTYPIGIPFYGKSNITITSVAERTITR